jgi:acetamidase/formamidase
MCFVHSGGAGLVQQAAVGSAAAAAFSSVGGAGGVAGGMDVAGSGGMDVAGSGTPDVVTGPGGPPPQAAEAAERVLDGFGRVLHNRWNRDLAPAAVVQPGEVVQLLCRDALDIGEAARTLTPEATMTVDLGRVHPLTGPVAVEGAEPGDILEVEVLDVSPLVDFGYALIGPALGLFGSLWPDRLAPLASFTEASHFSDPSPGPVPGAIPGDQPYNSGAPFVQLFTFERGQSSGFAGFTGADTGRQARIPITPFMGIYGVAPQRKGMYRTLPPSVSGGMGGNADIRQFVKGARIQFPVYAPGALFSAGDGHMAQGDGEVCVTAIETLMTVTVRFGVVKDTIITSPRAIVPAADPSQLAMTAEMLGQGYYHTTGIGPDLMENARNAVRDMVDWLVADQQLSLHEAYVLCSVAGDLKISEVVDLPNWVVSMTLPRGIFA